MTVKSAARDRGSTTISILLAVGVLLTVALWIVNVMIMQFGRASLRAALDDGARSGARVAVDDSSQVCTSTVLESLGPLNGNLVRDLELDCRLDTGAVVADATFTIEGWFGSISDHHGDLSVSVERVDG